MANKDWVWVCTCGAIIPHGPEGRHQYGAVKAHADQHRQAIADLVLVHDHRAEERRYARV